MAPVRYRSRRGCRAYTPRGALRRSWIRRAIFAYDWRPFHGIYGSGQSYTRATISEPRSPSAMYLVPFWPLLVLSTDYRRHQNIQLRLLSPPKDQPASRTLLALVSLNGPCSVYGTDHIAWARTSRATWESMGQWRPLRYLGLCQEQLRHSAAEAASELSPFQEMAQPKIRILKKRIKEGKAEVEPGRIGQRGQRTLGLDRCLLVKPFDACLSSSRALLSPGHTKYVC